MLVTNAAAWAQLPSSIVGTVRDESGGVLPGVTVEASSPALIGGARVVYTDAEGRYNVGDLRPGTYEVTFTLPGFSVIQRTGIVLTAGFTATVNADMAVGALEETITVTGEAPLVDTRRSVQQIAVRAEVMEQLPTGQTNVVDLIALTPGYTGNPQVGGTTGSYHSQQRNTSTFHGKFGSYLLLDGARIDNYAGNGSAAGYIFNSQVVEEMVVQTGGVGADSPSPNVLINMVGKEGSNTFRYSLSGVFSNGSMQADNIAGNAEIRARGLEGQPAPKIDRIYDAGGTIGGPIKQDSLWFFAAARMWGTSKPSVGLFRNANQGGMTYVPDLSRPALRDERYRSHATRITWNATERNRFNFFQDVKADCICESGGAGSGLGAGATTAAEAVAGWSLWPNGLVNVSWTSPRTEKLLLEAGASVTLFSWGEVLSDGVSVDHVSILERSTNFRYNIGTSFQPKRYGHRMNQRVAVSYVTSSHQFKVGFQTDEGVARYQVEPVGLPGVKGVSYEFLNGRPVGLVQYDHPNVRKHWQKAEMGIFVQDEWALNRVTLNIGARFDYYNGYVPAQELPPSLFLPARSYGAVPKAPEWKDINPRLGMTYDLFGDGRTAFKASFGRYVAQSAVNWVNDFNPSVTAVNNTSRSWVDANGNFLPDCDLHNFGANGECGQIANRFFGQANPNAVRFADDYRYGWGTRGYTWDFSSELQRELRQGMSLTAGYYHNWDGPIDVTRNEAVTAADHDTYCITAPVDPRLPDGGGYQVCGLADVKPEKFGQVSNLRTKSSNFGDYSKRSNFFALILDTRFGEGIRLNAGLDTGRVVVDQCYIVNSPQDLVNCRVVTPFAGNTQLKLNGSFPLPASFSVAATYQNLPGVTYLAQYAVPRAAVEASLGRPLSGGAQSVTVPLVAPQQLREDRRQQVDLRFSRTFDVGTEANFQLNLDLYNALNAAWVQGQFETYGPRWRQPSLLLDGRLIQLSGRLNF